jgi:hypothetical protein
MREIRRESLRTEEGCTSLAVTLPQTKDAQMSDSKHVIPYSST